jgi:hypothetical protein
MSDDPVVQAPARLIDEPTEVASWLTQSEAQFRGSLDERQAWKRVKPHLGNVEPQAKRHPILIASLATSAAAMAIGWYAGAHYAKRADRNENPVAAATSPGLVAPSLPSRPLPMGESILDDGTRALVLEGTQSHYSMGPDGAIVTLVNGRLEISVAHQANGKRFTVQCPKYELRVLATHFKVDVAAACVRIQVTNGRVAVFEGEIPRAQVESGGHWASSACAN